MNIVVINGDPNRKGSSVKMLEAYLEGIQTAEQDTVINCYNIASMRLFACEECDACKSSRITNCIIKDDMTGLYDSVYAADLIVLAFPIVRWHLPGKLKMLVDRLYAMDLTKVKNSNKKLSYFCTYRYENLDRSGVKEVNRYFDYVSEALNFDILHAKTYYHCNTESLLNTQVIEELKTLW